MIQIHLLVADCLQARLFPVSISCGTASGKKYYQQKGAGKKGFLQWFIRM
jgi:hypothetical protein